MGRQELIKYLVEVALFGKPPIKNFSMLCSHVDLTAEELRDVLNEKGLKHTVNGVLNGGRGEIDFDPDSFKQFGERVDRDRQFAKARFRTPVSHHSEPAPMLVRLNPNSYNLRNESDRRYPGCDDLSANSVGAAIMRRNSHERKLRRG